MYNDEKFFNKLKEILKGNKILDVQEADSYEGGVCKLVVENADGTICSFNICSVGLGSWIEKHILLEDKNHFYQDVDDFIKNLTDHNNEGRNFQIQANNTFIRFIDRENIWQMKVSDLEKSSSRYAKHLLTKEGRKWAAEDIWEFYWDAK